MPKSAIQLIEIEKQLTFCIKYSAVSENHVFGSTFVKQTPLCTFWIFMSSTVKSGSFEVTVRLHSWIPESVY